jgi:hypothetical protein
MEKRFPDFFIGTWCVLGMQTGVSSALLMGAITREADLAGSRGAGPLIGYTLLAWRLE